MLGPGFYDGISHSDYLADAEGPRLSASLAHLMLSKSPRQPGAGPPLLGACSPDESTDDRDRGTLLHALLLGGRNVIEVEADDYRTKAARELRDEIKAAGDVPVLTQKLEIANATAYEVTQSLSEIGFDLAEFATERVAFWQEGSVA